MKTIYLLLLNLTLTLSLQTANAGENDARSVRSNGLPLSEVTAGVLANNPAIKEALRKWNAAKARIPQAAAWDDPRLGGDTLQRPPRGYCEDHPLIEDLKRKDFIASIDLSQAQVCSGRLIEDFLSASRKMTPLLKFLSEAVKLRF